MNRLAILSALPTSRVCAAARRRGEVALSGDGGDEQFAGYNDINGTWRKSACAGFYPMHFVKGYSAVGSIYPELGWAPRVFRAKHTFQELA